MIFVCEPHCTSISHEKVNSGFLTLISRAYPNNEINFFAEDSHLDAIKHILSHDGIDAVNIGYHSFPLRNINSLSGIIVRFFQIKGMFSKLLDSNGDTICFLSSSFMMQYLVKYIKSKPRFKKIKCIFVLHAELERLIDDGSGSFLRPIEPSVSILDKLSTVKIENFHKKVIQFLKNRLRNFLSKVSSVYSYPFKMASDPKRVLYRGHNSTYRYIVLSPHIENNLAKLIDVEKLNFYCVVMPINFARYREFKYNSHPIFATFGFGYIPALKLVLEELKKKNIQKKYEVRVIGMDTRGLNGYRNLTFTSNGQVLSRQLMEHYSADVDLFLILYHSDHYRLSCSGSIFEAISYVKPILNIENSCIDFFNRPELPMGYSSKDIEDLATRMADIIENYESYSKEFVEFRHNILKLRDDLDLDNSIDILKSVFE